MKELEHLDIEGTIGAVKQLRTGPIDERIRHGLADRTLLVLESIRALQLQPDSQPNSYSRTKQGQVDL